MISEETLERFKHALKEYSQKLHEDGYCNVEGCGCYWSEMLWASKDLLDEIEKSK